MKLISDKRIQDILRVRKDEILSKPDAWASYRFIAQAQLEADQRELYEEIVRLNKEAQEKVIEIFDWGEEQCQGHHTSGIWFKRRECTKCWQALKQSLEDKK